MSSGPQNYQVKWLYSTLKNRYIILYPNLSYAGNVFDMGTSKNCVSQVIVDVLIARRKHNTNLIKIAHAHTAKKQCSKRCKYCSSNDHNTSAAFCPEQKKQLEIKKIMITKQLSFVEAKSLAENDAPQQNSTFANVVNLAQQLEKLKKEMEEFKNTNTTLKNRLFSAEIIIESFKSLHNKQTKDTYTNSDSSHAQTTIETITVSDNLTTDNSLAINSSPINILNSPQININADKHNTIIDDILRKIEIHNSTYKSSNTTTPAQLSTSPKNNPFKSGVVGINGPPNTKIT